MKCLACFWTYFTDCVLITQCPRNVSPLWFILYSVFEKIGLLFIPTQLLNVVVDTKVRYPGDNSLVPIRAEQSNPSLTPCALCWRKLKGEAVRQHSSPGMLVLVLDSN